MKNNILLILFLIILPICLYLFMYFMLWWTASQDPDYIKWDKKGIYIIDKREKEVFIDWEDVKSIQSLKNVYGPGKGLPDYAITKKFGVTRRINEDIGKQLKQAWIKYR